MVHRKAHYCVRSNQAVDRRHGARMRHYSSNTERLHNIIHALNSSAGILPPDRSVIESLENCASQITV